MIEMFKKFRYIERNNSTVADVRNYIKHIFCKVNVALTTRTAFNRNFSIGDGTGTYAKSSQFSFIALAQQFSII
ncbi:hypothetical protein ASG47_14080 [Devosia sp. Leaf420]|nr:hypothetical protein ASG47_14080 [Devosia sp. Leaf420]